MKDSRLSHCGGELKKVWRDIPGTEEIEVEDL